MKKNKIVLTPRQSDIFKFIKGFQARNGMPPTREEICSNFGFKSKTAADDHIKAIAKRGWIEIIPIKSRGIKIL